MTTSDMNREPDLKNQGTKEAQAAHMSHASHDAHATHAEHDSSQDTRPLPDVRAIRPDWYSLPLPLSTVRRPPSRVQGRVLAVTSLSGIVLGMLLSVSLYLFSLVNLVQPLAPLGDPSVSLEALDALLAADQQASGVVSSGNALGGAAASLMQAQKQFDAAQDIAPRADRKVRNVLLVSKPLDSSIGKINSEAMLLLSINKRSDRIRLVAFDRTMPANIPGKSWSLLAHAAFMGGPDLVRQTLAENYRLQIDDAFVFDIAELEKAIDLMMGVLVQVNAEEVVYLRMNHPQLNIYEGVNRMNGEQAVAFSQIVGVGGRNAPNRRLLQVFKGIHARSAKLSALEVKMLAQAILPGLQTGLEPVDRFQALMDVVTARRYPLSTLTLADEDPADEDIQTIFSRQKREAGDAYRVKALHNFLFDS